MNSAPAVSIMPPAPSHDASDGYSQRLAELDLSDSHSVLFFGSLAQKGLTEVSDRMLERVRTKDTGPAGEALNDMVLMLRGFDAQAADGARPTGWFDRLLGRGRGRGVARLLQRFERVRDQIDLITSRLHEHQTDLMIDIETLDRLYEANLDYFHQLEAYIKAGEERLKVLDDEEVPRLAASVEEAGDAIGAQRLHDLRSVRDALERRLNDLRLTRQVALQGMPSLRLVQDNDRSLVAKIDSTLTNTVPLWRQQLAQALSIQRARDAARAVTAANDLTNELLRNNAENLRLANRETREQIERGVFDIDAIGEANRTLIATIEDSLLIAEQGRSARASAAEALTAMESQLRDTLTAVKSRSLS